jgi:hypothetical protein
MDVLRTSSIEQLRQRVHPEAGEARRRTSQLRMDVFFGWDAQLAVAGSLAVYAARDDR